jgi:hypothetical protein
MNKGVRSLAREVNHATSAALKGTQEPRWPGFVALLAGGPVGRDKRTGPVPSAFLFPQMVSQPGTHWSPQFIDYLFLAFNTSTAFSPTDTAILGRWAKILTMLQSLISLSVLVILAARAINVL